MPADCLKSEESIIQDYFAPLAVGFEGALGLRDDCAVITVAPGSQLVVKTDPIRQNVHFFADDAAGDIAWKALAVNVSDLAAKSATPLAYVMALSFPQPPDRHWLRDFAQGLQEAQDAFTMHLIGGDTDRAPGPLTIAITAFGTVPMGKMVQRGTAQPGDLLFVSGSLGDAALGLKIRSGDGRWQRWGLTNEQRDHLVQRYLRPSPRLAAQQALRHYASAAMDLSDGLAKDAARLCKSAKLQAQISFTDLPLSPAAAQVLANAPAECSSIIAAGDDYEILATVSPQNASGFRAAALQAGFPVQQIGVTTIAPPADPSVVILDADGQAMDLTRPGWDHF